MVGEGSETYAYKMTMSNMKNYGDILKIAKSHLEAVTTIQEALLEKLSLSLAIPAGSINPDKPIHTYGVDSLLAVGLRTWFKKEFRANVSVFDIVSNSSLVSSVVSKSEWYLGDQ